MTITQDFADAHGFLTALDNARRANPQQWIFYHGRVGGRYVDLKTFGHTYLQRFTIDDYCPRLPPMDCKVGVWRVAILEAFGVC